MLSRQLWSWIAFSRVGPWAMYCQQALHRICSHFLQTQIYMNKVILASLRTLVSPVICPFRALFPLGQHRCEQAAPLWTGHDPSPRHSTRWEVGAPSRPVLGFQPLVAVSSLPFLVRPQHNYVAIWMCHSKLSGLKGTTTNWSSIRDWVTCAQSSCPVGPRYIQALFWGWCRSLHWAVVVALRQWDSFPSSCSALQSLW